MSAETVKYFRWIKSTRIHEDLKLMINIQENGPSFIFVIAQTAKP